MAPPKKEDSTASRFVRGAGTMGNTANLPFPIRWIAQLVQYLIALMLVAFAKAIKHTFERQPRKQPTTGATPKTA